MSSVTHNFTVDSNIISHIISHQAGTVTKAIMELVMNGVDAGATRIDIRFDTDENTGNVIFSVADNGSGFQSEEDIINLFGRFGTPHTEEEDSAKNTVYGRFRMGRGQIMAFSACSWQSGRYKMDVDIKKNGLKYDLYTDMDDEVDGCIVSGTLYDDANRSYVSGDYRHITGHELELAFKFVPAEIFFNGKKINIDPAQEEWDHEDEYFYFKLNKYSDLVVYNLGVFVSKYSKAKYGGGGIIVSKKPINVNFARNDIIYSDCDTWGHIEPIIASIFDKENKKDVFVKVPKDMRGHFVHEFCRGAINPYDFIRYKIFEDSNGKIHSLLDIVGKGCNFISVAGKNKTAYMDYVSSFDEVFLFAYDAPFTLNPEHGSDNPIILILNTFNNIVRTLFSFLDYAYYEANNKEAHLTGISVLRNNLEDFGIFWDMTLFSKNSYGAETGKEKDFLPLFQIIKWYIPLYLEDVDGLRDFFPYKHRIIPNEALTEEEKIVLKTARVVNRDIISLVRGAFVAQRGGVCETDIMPNIRKVFIGDSGETVDGWTDCRSFIAIDRALAGEVLNQGKGRYNSSALFRLIAVMIHEYMHTKDSSLDNHHDLDFYKSFHDFITERKFTTYHPWWYCGTEVHHSTETRKDINYIYDKAIRFFAREVVSLKGINAVPANVFKAANINISSFKSKMRQIHLLDKSKKNMAALLFCSEIDSRNKNISSLYAYIKFESKTKQDGSMVTEPVDAYFFYNKMNINLSLDNVPLINSSQEYIDAYYERLLVEVGILLGVQRIILCVYSETWKSYPKFYHPSDNKDALIMDREIFSPREERRINSLELTKRKIAREQGSELYVLQEKILEAHNRIGTVGRICHLNSLMHER